MFNALTLFALLVCLTWSVHAYYYDYEPQYYRRPRHYRYDYDDYHRSLAATQMKIRRTGGDRPMDAFESWGASSGKEIEGIVHPETNQQNQNPLYAGGSNAAYKVTMENKANEISQHPQGFVGYGAQSSKVDLSAYAKIQRPRSNAVRSRNPTPFLGKQRI
jgi:hypothetical protein